MHTSQKDGKLLGLALGILVVIILLLNPWFRTTFAEDKLIAFLSFIGIIFLILFSYNGKPYFRITFIFLFLLLAIFQFKTTNTRYLYSSTAAEIDLELARMNYYPPELAKLGYILETNKLVKISEKISGYFIESLDFNQYFPDYFSYWLLPFFFLGLYWFFDNRFPLKSTGSNRMISYCLCLSISILTILGTKGNYGPFLVFPFFTLFIFWGFYGLSKKIIKHI